MFRGFYEFHLSIPGLAGSGEEVILDGSSQLVQLAVAMNGVVNL